MESAAATKLARTTRSIKSALIGDDQRPDGGAPVDPWSSKTPEKSMQLRGRNRGVALAVKDVKRVARGLRESDVVRSTKRQLLSSPDGKSKAVDVDESVSSSSKLPEKHEMLCETFHSLDCVVRLMRMKGVTPAFSNVLPKVEQLTDRRLTHEQLAQVKFILGDLIVLKKVLVLDEGTSCMKSDIHISFKLDVINTDGKVKGGSGKLQLSKIFRSRLLDFYRSHSEDTDIPEGPLPEPFGRLSEGLPPSTVDPRNSQVTAEPNAGHLSEDNIAASHISHSFKKRFSKKTASLEDASDLSDSPRTSELAAAKSQLSRCTTKEDIDVHVTSPQMEYSIGVPHCDPTTNFPARCPSLSSPSLQATPSKQRTSMDNNPSTEMTPSKFGSVPTTPMTATPTPLTPKRSLMSPDDDISHKTSNKLVRRSVRARSLKFDTSVNEYVEDDCHREKLVSCSSIDSELADTLDDDLLQSIMEKERKAREESDPAISQAKRRRDMIAGLPKLFNMVHFYFRSINRSLVTKEELMHNLITSHSDFLDKREVEEQLKLLQELTPEYISETIALSGDKLIRVNKASDADSIRARLAEAI